MSPIGRRTPLTYDSKGDALVQNLEGIARGVPDYARLADVPMAYQRHIIGVSSHLHHLLRRLVRAVTCYHEHHAD